MGENADRSLGEMKERLSCKVEPGNWGVAYGVAWQVITWGEITQVFSDQEAVCIEMEINELPNNCFSRKYVEIFPSREEAEKRFKELWSKRSEGG